MDKQEPMVPLMELISKLLNVSKVDINQLNIITGGLSHFFGIKIFYFFTLLNILQFS